MMIDVFLCDDHYDPARPEIAMSPFPGLNKCAECGKNATRVQWRELAGVMMVRETWRCECGYDMPVQLRVCVKCGTRRKP